MISGRQVNKDDVSSLVKGMGCVRLTPGSATYWQAKHVSLMEAQHVTQLLCTSILSLVKWGLQLELLRELNFFTWVKLVEQPQVAACAPVSCEANNRGTVKLLRR